MADNLTIQITADTSSLQAQLALAKAEVTAYGAEVRRGAADINSGNTGPRRISAWRRYERAFARP